MIDDNTNIVYATVDSLRYDRVTENTMPYLASLRENGVWFEDMHSVAPATAASFTGLMASRYYSDIDGIGLPAEEFSTLAEALPPRYHCVGRSTNQFTSAYYNYDRGFDWFNSPSQGLKFQVRRHLDEDGPLFKMLEWSYQQALLVFGGGGEGGVGTFNTRAQTVHNEVRDRLHEPFFAWLHYMDPHHPYEPPAEWLPDSVPDKTTAQRISRDLPGRVPDDRQDDLGRCRELYDAECRAWDDAFRTFHESLPDDTLLIVVGDHGELLGEHGRLGHPHEMWSELVHVPCLIYHPDVEPTTIESQQTTLDLAPTILDLVGARTPAAMRGTPIDLRHGPDPSEVVYGVIETPENVAYARASEVKWLRHHSRRSTQDDHGELLVRCNSEEDVDGGRRLAGNREDVVARLRGAFTDEIGEGTGATARQMADEQVKRHMADLGYLEQQ